MVFLEIILALIVVGVVVWGVRAIVAILPIDAWMKTVIQVLVVVGLVIYVVYWVIAPLLHHIPLRMP